MALGRGSKLNPANELAMQEESKAGAHCSCSCQVHSTAARKAAEPMAGRIMERSLLCSKALSEAAMSTGTAVPAYKALTMSL